MGTSRFPDPRLKKQPRKAFVSKTISLGGTYAPLVHTHLFSDLSGTLGNYANDAAAAAGGIAVGKLYRNGSVVMIRVA